MNEKGRGQWSLVSGWGWLALAIWLGALFAGCSSNVATADASKFDTLSITVKRITSDTSAKPVLLFQRTIHQARQVQQVYQEITALHRTTSDEIYNCPIAFSTYTLYDLRFQHQNTLLAEATINRTGCEFWVVKDAQGTTVATYCCGENTLWAEWQKELNIPDLTVRPTR
jgi:hypothetical protein